jgi:hypothetical protein
MQIIRQGAYSNNRKPHSDSFVVSKVSLDVNGVVCLEGNSRSESGTWYRPHFHKWTVLISPTEIANILKGVANDCSDKRTLLSELSEQLPSLLKLAMGCAEQLQSEKTESE